MRGMSVGVLMVTVVAALASCASRPITYMPDGRVGYGVTCNRFYESWISCMVKAGRLCGSRGYTTYYSDEVNHRTDPGELHTLSEAGIVSLSLGYTFEPTEQGGNWLYEVSHATLADGRQIEMADAYFAVDQAGAAAALAAQAATSTSGAHTATLTIHSLLNPAAPIIVPQTALIARPIPLPERAAQAAQAGASLSPSVSPLSAQDGGRLGSVPLTARSSLLSGEQTMGGQGRTPESTASPARQVPPLSDPLTGPWGPWTAAAQPTPSTADDLPVIGWSARHEASAHRSAEPPLYRPWMASVLGVEPNGSGDLARVTGLRVSVPERGGSTVPE